MPCIAHCGGDKHGSMMHQQQKESLMEARDLEILEKYMTENFELKELWDEHVLFKKQLEKLEAKPFLTPAEKLTVSELKKQKLDGKTRLQAMLDGYKAAEG